MTPQEQIQKMIEDLLRVATRHKVCVVGFAFSVETPMLANFGNTTDYTKEELYVKLVKFYQKRRAEGGSIDIEVGEVS